MKVRVRCSFVVDVELPDDCDPYFTIEDNGCPGTGAVQMALEKIMVEHDNASTCWACAAEGKNEILEVIANG